MDFSINILDLIIFKEYFEDKILIAYDLDR